MKKIIKKILVACLLLSSTPGWAQSKPCREVIGYYCDWLQTTVDYSKYTIINYAFVQPKIDGTIDDATATKLSALVSACHQNNTKVMLSVGGWTWSNNFPTFAASSAGRTKFANECLRCINKYGLDGIDIDWEYPGYADHAGTPADKGNFTLLMKAIRSAIGNKLLSSCFGVASSRMQQIEWNQVIPVIDMFNLMTYDFFGSWDAVANHNSPLYAPAQGDPGLNLNAAFKALVNTYAVPSSKINVGGAFYGHSFAGCSALFGSFTGPDGDGSPTYAAIMANKSGYTDYWDDNAKVPYMINPTAKKFISYDNERSIQMKGEYVISNNARGVIIWEISGDRIGGTNPLAAALTKGLCGTVGVKEQNEHQASFYPNPATDAVYVTIANGDVKNNVSVYNSLGQLVISEQFNGYQFQLDIKGLEKGFYFVNIVNESGTISKKIIKE